jgi:hypothetical protein
MTWMTTTASSKSSATISNSIPRSSVPIQTRPASATSDAETRSGVVVVITCIAWALPTWWRRAERVPPYDPIHLNNVAQNSPQRRDALALGNSRRESVRFGRWRSLWRAPRGASSMAEQRTFNPWVQGSSPWRPTSQNIEVSAHVWDETWDEWPSLLRSDDRPAGMRLLACWLRLCRQAPTGPRISRSAGVDVAAVACRRHTDNAPLVIDRVHDPVVADPASASARRPSRPQTAVDLSRPTRPRDRGAGTVPSSSAVSLSRCPTPGHWRFEFLPPPGSSAHVGRRVLWPGRWSPPGGSGDDNGR